MAWATVAETLTYTGIAVDSTEPAQAIIELFADVTEDSDANISSKNLRLLKQAVAYQAAWMTEHPDIFTHVDIRTLLQDGIQFSVLHANSGVLAPLAYRALNRLSWRRNRSHRIRRSRRQQVGGMPVLTSFHTVDSEDDDSIWEDM